MNENTMLKAALAYAAMGWHIFPCRPGTKVPMTTNGVKNATTDEATIRDWWTRCPTANIAVACGPASGIYVVDVDVDEARGINGWDSIEEFPPFPDTVRQDTPRGGAHFFFRSDTPPRNRNSFRPGIDIRSDGYYVMLPPSLHPNGKPYKWTEGFAPGETGLAEFPDFMRPPGGREPLPWERKQAKAATPAPRPAPLAPIEINDVVSRARAYLLECDPAVQGQAGHDKLLWAARVLVVGFELDTGTAINMLWDDYNPRCIPPWDRSDTTQCRDFERKVHEAARTPSEKPRGWLLDKYGLRSSDQQLAQGTQLQASLLATASTVAPEPAPPDGDDADGGNDNAPAATKPPAHDRTVSVPPKWAELKARIVGGDVLLTTAIPQSDPMLAGVFDLGDKVALLAPSKTRKSFFLIQLCLCLATGRDFLGFKVLYRRHVLFVNLELKDTHFQRRLVRMAGGLGITASDLPEFHVLNARGLGMKYDEMPGFVQWLNLQIEFATFDPLYKLADGDENSARDMKPVLAAFDQIAAMTGAAVAYSHHDAKGSPGDRDIRDRGAGSNVIGRDYDAAITLTPHGKEEGALVVGFLCRNYKSPDPLSVRFDDESCIFRPASDLPPVCAASKQPREQQSGDKWREYIEDAVELALSGAWLKSEFQARLRKRFDLPGTQIDKLYRAARDDERVHTDKGPNKGTSPRHLIGNENAVKARIRELNNQGS
ncbi:MAG: AAA family ATPase [Lentisphaerae bacterium]|jgi:hypothetical protein|nr:AAA family ATPase [Lentisphaerota bacterium]